MELNMISVVIFAEHLRNRLLSAKPPLIKSRRQLFRSYPNTFVGSEVVEWWTKEWRSEIEEKSEKNNNEATTSEDAFNNKEETIDITEEHITQVMQTLADFGILHSLHGEIPFKNDSSLYRFTTDDGSSCGLVEALVKGKRLHETTTCPNCALLQRVCEYGEFISDQCMRGSDLIAWTIEHGLATHKDDANRLCRLMFDHGIIKPASKQVTEFTDGRPFYLFGVSYGSPPMMLQTFVSLLNSSFSKQIASTSAIENGDNKIQHVRQLSGQLLDLSVQDSKGLNKRRKNTSSSSIGSDDSGYNEHALVVSSSTSTSTYTSLLKHGGKITAEALAHPDAPFTRREFRIYPDAVGYGFIIRGSSPCYVKIVDPESPAGKSGLKAWQFITEINNRDVTRKNHTEIEDLILNGPKCLLMTVMVPKNESDYLTLQKQNTDLRKLSQPADTHIPKPVLSHLSSSLGLRRQSVPVSTRPTNLPSAQPWMKKQRKGSDFGVILNNSNLKYIH
ncbi:DEP domain-containing mTOR-interacting protein-like [Styela clava]